MAAISKIFNSFGNNKPSNSIKLLRFLSDGKYHSNVELDRIAGWRFGGVIWELKQKGVKFSKKGRNTGDEQYIEYWKLDYVPSNLDYSGKRLKIIKS